MQFELNKWLSRLAFSFFVIAFVLIWEMNKASRDPMSPRWKIAALLAGAVLCGVLGIFGIRARHRGQ